MKYDAFGQAYTTEQELCDLLYINPELNLSLFLVEDPQAYNKSAHALYADVPFLKTYIPFDVGVDEFDRVQQAHWRMPEEYCSLDIARWVLEQCGNDAELQRCGQELLLYQERNLLPLLCYLKYLVDTLRANNVVWGVGRGSSVASYVLYKIGVHRIDSLYYDLDPAEFLK